MWEQEEIDKTLAQRDKALTESGVKFTSAYWKRTYNLQDGDLDETPVPAESSEFAESPLKPILDQVALDQAINSLPAELLQEQSEQAVASLIETLLRARTDTRRSACWPKPTRRWMTRRCRRTSHACCSWPTSGVA